MFETPPLEATKLIPWPSGIQRTGMFGSAIGTSKVLVGGPPEMGMMAICQGEAGGCRYQQTIHRPSGETSGHVESLSVSCTGVPPSIETFQSVKLVELVTA